jgi:hypothetical protein
LIASGDSYDFALQAIGHFISGYVASTTVENKSPRSNFSGGAKRLMIGATERSIIFQ